MMPQEVCALGKEGHALPAVPTERVMVAAEANSSAASGEVCKTLMFSVWIRASVGAKEKGQSHFIHLTPLLALAEKKPVALSSG